MILTISFLQLSWLVAGLAILFVTIKIDQVTDYKIWLQRNNITKRISHGFKAMMLRGIGFVPACYCSWWIPFHNLWILTAGIIFYLFLFLMCFNGFFNTNATIRLSFEKIFMGFIYQWRPSNRTNLFRRLQLPQSSFD